MGKLFHVIFQYDSFLATISFGISDSKSPKSSSTLLSYICRPHNFDSLSILLYVANNSILGFVARFKMCQLLWMYV